MSFLRVVGDAQHDVETVLKNSDDFLVSQKIVHALSVSANGEALRAVKRWSHKPFAKNQLL